MSFVRSVPGAILILLGVALLAASGAVVVEVHRLTSPERKTGPVIDFESMSMQVEEVHFQSVDAVYLRGWLLRGTPGLPAIVMCHDLGSNRASLTHLAVALRARGFTLLVFDFRGHGESAGSHSTLGLKEKRDILGALDYLEGIEGVDTERIGIYGVGMGAYAAVLAAADRPSLRVLVLDGLYPDVTYRLSRGVYDAWHFGVDHLGFAPLAAFTVLNQARLTARPASAVLEDLMGRDTLLVASEGDAELGSKIKVMYERIPEQTDVDGNLVILPATHGEGLYGSDLVLYHERITAFFDNRLARWSAAPVPVS